MDTPTTTQTTPPKPGRQTRTPAWLYRGLTISVLSGLAVAAVVGVWNYYHQPAAEQAAPLVNAAQPIKPGVEIGDKAHIKESELSGGSINGSKPPKTGGVHIGSGAVIKGSKIAGGDINETPTEAEEQESKLKRTNSDLDSCFPVAMGRMWKANIDGNTEASVHIAGQVLDYIKDPTIQTFYGKDDRLDILNAEVYALRAKSRLVDQEDLYTYKFGVLDPNSEAVLDIRNDCKVGLQTALDTNNYLLKEDYHRILLELDLMCGDLPGSKTQLSDATKALNDVSDKELLRYYRRVIPIPPTTGDAKLAGLVSHLGEWTNTPESDEALNRSRVLPRHKLAGADLDFANAEVSFIDRNHAAPKDMPKLLGDCLSRIDKAVQGYSDLIAYRPLAHAVAFRNNILSQLNTANTNSLEVCVHDSKEVYGDLGKSVDADPTTTFVVSLRERAFVQIPQFRADIRLGRGDYVVQAGAPVLSMQDQKKFRDEGVNGIKSLLSENPPAPIAKNLKDVLTEKNYVKK
jgi:hypothetical protein